MFRGAIQEHAIHPLAAHLNTKLKGEPGEFREFVIRQKELVRGEGATLVASPRHRPKQAVQAEADQIAVATGETGTQGFELALAAETLLFAGRQFVANAVTENLMEP